MWLCDCLSKFVAKTVEWSWRPPWEPVGPRYTDTSILMPILRSPDDCNFSNFWIIIFFPIWKIIIFISNLKELNKDWLIWGRSMLICSVYLSCVFSGTFRCSGTEDRLLLGLQIGHVFGARFTMYMRKNMKPKEEKSKTEVPVEHRGRGRQKESTRGPSPGITGNFLLQ